MARKKPTEKQVADLYEIAERLSWLVWNSHKKGYGSEGDEIIEVIDKVAEAMGLQPDYKRHLDEDQLACPEEVYQAGPPDLARDQR